MQKQVIQQVLDAMPDDVDIDDLLDRIVLLEKIEAAELRLKAGEGVPHAQAKEQMQAWLK